VLLTFEEERISYDFSFNVTCKMELSLTSSLDVLWLEIGQKTPFLVVRRITDPVVKSIYAALRSSCLHVSRFFLSFVSRCDISNTLCDVIVLLSASDFSPKS